MDATLLSPRRIVQRTAARLGEGLDGPLLAITALLVVDGEGRVIGAFNVHDLLQAGVM